MLSKEEREKIKRGLTEELGRTITANECGLSTNDFSESIEILEGALKYIEQLETDKQKLIEKLECAIDFGKTGTDVATKIKIECLENVLNILKGKK